MEHSSHPSQSMLFSDEAIRQLEFFREVRHLRLGENDTAELDAPKSVEEDPVQINEVEYDESFEALPTLVSANAIAQFLGLNKSWVSNQLHLMGAESTLTLSASNHAYSGYDKELIPVLRRIYDEIALQDTAVSLVDLENRTGLNRKTIKNVLENAGLEPFERRANHNRRVALFYDESSEDIIDAHKKETLKPAENWKTVKATAMLTKRSEDWVLRRFRPFEPEMRVAKNNVSLPHYPPEAVEAAISAAQKEEAYPIATEEDVAIRALAKRVHKRDSWVIDRLPYTTATVEMKRNPANNRAYYYATPDPTEELLELPGDVLDTDWRPEYMQPLVGMFKGYLEKRREAYIEERKEQVRRRIEMARKLAVIQQRSAPAMELRIEQEEDDTSDWRIAALCAETDPEVFFPEKGGSTRDAKKICASCDVKNQCLEYALEHDEEHGIWGGLSRRQRQNLMKK